MNIYVGNLSPDTSEDKLRKLFEQYGKVASINIIKDKFSGRPLRFGFVKMPLKEPPFVPGTFFPSFPNKTNSPLSQNHLSPS